jgi:hypothetical protein
MAKSRSYSETSDNNGDITSETESTSTTESDSIVIKRNAKGEVSWDIKAYGVIDNAEMSDDLRNKIVRIDLDLKRQYDKD